MPLLAVFSAFSFVLMMFNLPLPGGTTGHAVGMGIASIVLGPWMAMLAVSVALLVQAVFFGDGGISAYGANASTWRSLARLWRTASTQWEVFALAFGLAGVSWLPDLRVTRASTWRRFWRLWNLACSRCLFHDTNGTPLYAPYPLTCRCTGNDDRTPHVRRLG